MISPNNSGRLAITVAVIAVLTSQPRALASDTDKLFTLKVLPLLKEKCFGCHATDPNDLKGDYNVSSREHLLEGGESGEPSLVPGDPEASLLYQAIMWDGYEMPPKENDRLTEEQTEYFREWIAGGAVWPSVERQDAIRREEWAVRENSEGLIVATSGGLSEDWTYRRYQAEDIWAFQELPSTTEIRNMAEFRRHPIDVFVNEKLTEANLQPANVTDMRTLLRRATYDLTGLPPTPSQFDQFRDAWSVDRDAAFNALIDRLLASNHYGERWAQHWLDVVRYADTSGFSNDYERSNMWRYRDYVIRSFNSDKPFNQFVVEQIAGDELVEVAEQTAGDKVRVTDVLTTDFNVDPSAAIVATGFLRMGPWGTAMIPQDEARQLFLDDLVHNTGQSFLSMPMRCCKCHDHKFDPIPTRDYYRLYAAFSGTQPAEIDADFLPTENQHGFAEKRQLVEELLAYAKAEQQVIQDKQESAAKAWYAEHNLPYKNENARKNDPEDMKPPRHVGLTPEEQGIKKVREQDVWIWERRLERYEPMAQGVYNGPDKWTNDRKLRRDKKPNLTWRPSSFILAGGALEAKSEPVGPGVLSGPGLPVTPAALASQASMDPYRLSDDLIGRRLQLARWIASDDNPLTARSIVNRIWHYHFGKGLVNTPNNFGAKGGKPTHPQLLNWLTADFIEHGWKIKRLHRLIMTSDTYQRSGKHENLQALETADPNNELLARFPPRRLTAEEIRDSTLAISGELNREMGGVPIMPEINMEVALQPRMIQFSIAPAHQPSRTPDERNRRTIYAYRVRGQADPMLEIMNLPNPNESCELRDSAAVTPQAFTLMNSDVMTDRSIAFAAAVLQEQKQQHPQHFPDDRPDHLIRRVLQKAYCRLPTSDELDQLRNYYNEMLAYHDQHQPQQVEYPTQVTRSLVEEFTGQPFEFIELLNVYNDYVPDKKPWTVNAKTRALADVCLLLFNSNEFMYVY